MRPLESAIWNLQSNFTTVQSEARVMSRIRFLSVFICVHLRTTLSDLIELEIMSGFRGFIAFLVLFPLWILVSGGQAWADEPDPGRDDQLGLADLAGYRAALSGKAIADDARHADPPARVGFRDLWERPDAYRGRRVTVRGRVARIFRQGPVGSFPPLLQVWIFSPVGDPFCLVFPRPTAGTGGGQETVTASPTQTDHRPGRTVRFTGTFLKMVRYAAGDGERLAPLIVGDRPPGPAPAEADGLGDRSSKAGGVPRAIGGANPAGAGLDRWGWSPASWGLGLMLAVIAAGILARQHLREAPLRSRSAMRDRLLDPATADPPLLFVDHTDDSLV
jgi:hypothetical protein